MKTIAGLIALGASLIGTQALAETSTLRISAWNIADFHHKNGTQARPGIGTARTADDFGVIEKYERQVGADIYALQEIATPQALERLFDKEKYHLLMSGRYVQDQKAGKKHQIYTALIIQKRDDIKLIKQEDLKSISIEYDDDGDKKITRRGTAALIEVRGTQFWIVSLHLKSSCSGTKKANTSTTLACRVLWKQQKPLRDWIVAKEAKGEPVILAGDYNRRFRQFADKGIVWSAMNGGDLDSPSLVKYPVLANRLCPTKKGKSTEPIDWIVMSNSLGQKVVQSSFWETRYSKTDTGKSGKRISDHCPIHVDIEFSN